MTQNYLIRIDQVFHWLKNNKKQYTNEVKRNLVGAFTFLNMIETLRLHGSIINLENFHYYVLYLKKNLKKKLECFTIFYLTTLFTGGIFPF